MFQLWVPTYLSSGVNNATISLNGTNKVGPCLLAAMQWMIVNVCGKSTVFPSTCQPKKKIGKKFEKKNQRIRIPTLGALIHQSFIWIVGKVSQSFVRNLWMKFSICWFGIRECFAVTHFFREMNFILPCHGSLTGKHQKSKHDRILNQLVGTSLSQRSWGKNKYSWVHNRRVYSFIWHPRNMKKETDIKRDKSI